MGAAQLPQLKLLECVTTIVYGILASLSVSECLRGVLQLATCRKTTELFHTTLLLQDSCPLKKRVKIGVALKYLIRLGCLLQRQHEMMKDNLS